MKTKTTQILFVLLAAIFTAGIIWFVGEGAAATAVSGAFTAVVSLFLGVDIATMLHKTRAMRDGDFEKINMHRYIIALCIFAFLLIETFIISAKYGREVNSLYLCFGCGFLTVIGGVISGIEGNKIVTGEGRNLNE